MERKLVLKLLRETHLVRQPKHLLSTFGATHIEYHLVSPVEDMPDKTRLREGRVLSEKPKIITPEALRERFEGFGEDAPEFARWLSSEYRELLRALEYRFKNTGLHTRVLSQAPRLTAERIHRDLDERDVAQGAVVACPDAGWSLALMKLTLDEASRAFPVNVRDLDQHGLFEPGSNEARRRRHEVESLFAEARRDPAARQALAAKLKEYGLFSEFEDRYLALFA